jgi:hypothetical protein
MKEDQVLKATSTTSTPSEAGRHLRELAERTNDDAETQELIERLADESGASEKLEEKEEEEEEEEEGENPYFVKSKEGVWYTPEEDELRFKKSYLTVSDATTHLQNKTAGKTDFKGDKAKELDKFSEKSEQELNELVEDAKIVAARRAPWTGEGEEHPEVSNAKRKAFVEARRLIKSVAEFRRAKAEFVRVKGGNL